jgi:DNA-binding GntR family transcriptional regulator
LVEIVRNKGFRVRVLSQDELDDIFQVRSMLEVPSIVMLARRDSLANMTELTGLAHEIQELASRADMVASVSADRHFHVQLISQLGNEYLADLVGRLRDVTIVAYSEFLARARQLELVQRAKELHRNSREHLAILDAINRHDAAGAERVMMKHLEASRKLVSAVDYPTRSRAATRSRIRDQQ